MKKGLFIHLTIGSALLFTHTQAFAQTLQEALQYTLQTNPSFLITTSDRLAIGQELKQAQANYLPTVDVNAGYGRERLTSASIGNTPTGAADTSKFNRGEADISLNQMLFDGFATKSEVSRNSARVNSAIYRVRGTAEDLGLKAAQVYLEVLHRENIVELAKENLAQHEQTFRMIEKRSQSGISNKADLIQAEGRLALAKSTLQAAEGNLRNTQTNYLQVVGVLSQNLNVPHLAEAALPSSEKQTVQQALANHPLLKADLAAAKSTNMPRVDLQVNATNDHNVGGIQGPNNDVTAMVRMKYNLFHGSADEARQRQTAYLVQKATEAKNRTWREVEQTARLSWNALQTTRMQLANLQKHQIDAKQITELYRKQFELSQRMLLDLLDSQSEFFNARNAYTDAQYVERFAEFRVINSLGKLLDTLKASLPVEADLSNNT